MIEINLDNFEPIESFPYGHCVRDVIIENEISSEYEAKNDPLFHEWHSIIKQAKEKFNYIQDNKTVIKLKHKQSDLIMYIGSWDWEIRIGFNVEKFY